MAVRILVAFDAHGPLIEEVARAVAQGARGAPGAAVSVKPIAEATRDDLLAADAIILGSPNWSGVTGTMKSWLDSQGDLWLEGALAGKVGAAFAVGRGRHSGMEFTLLSLLHWMLACGMVVLGLPFNEQMAVSGSYYGATATGQVEPEDLVQGRVLGRRVAETTLRFKRGSITGGATLEGPDA